MVIAEIADRVLSEVRIVERQHFQVGQSVQVQHFFKAANLIARNVEVIEVAQLI